MRKLVLGIIAVICVQFAFVNFTVLQSPLDLSTAPVQNEADLRDVSTIESGDSKDLGEPVPGTVVADLPVEPRVVRARRVAVDAPQYVAARATSVRRASRPILEPAPIRNAAPSDFETVVIRYDRGPDISDCETREIPKSKKRSYIAKAVFQKPWEWIKSVGSKLH